VHDNSLRGGIPAAISACSNLTHLVVGGNQLSGSLPPVLAGLKDLQVIDVSRNNLSGELPGELSKLVRLKRFLANDSHFTGRIPDFNLSEEADKFIVSNNNLTGPIPKNVVGKFRSSRFWLPNADGICGQPVFARCPSSQSPPSSSDSEADKDGQSKSRRGKRSARKIAMYIGFALLGAVILALVLYLCLRKMRNNKLERTFKLGGDRRVSDSSKATTTTPTTQRKSVYSLPTSAEQSSAAAGTPSAPSTSLVVLRRSGTASITTPAAAAAAKELRFEDLLKSPAELLGRGRFGSSYKVVVPGGAALVVKRVKDAEVGEDVFRRRMELVMKPCCHRWPSTAPCRRSSCCTSSRATAAWPGSCTVRNKSSSRLSVLSPHRGRVGQGTAQTNQTVCCRGPGHEQQGAGPCFFGGIMSRPIRRHGPQHAGRVGVLRPESVSGVVAGDSSFGALANSTVARHLPPPRGTSHGYLRPANKPTYSDQLR
jgi:hypothetical protein